MKRPSLRVSKWMADIPVEGECTSCVGVRFTVKPISHRLNREEYQKSLQSAFAAHLKKAHLSSEADDSRARSSEEAAESA